VTDTQKWAVENVNDRNHTQLRVRETYQKFAADAFAERANKLFEEFDIELHAIVVKA
jgi:hypothetical protein